MAELTRDQVKEWLSGLSVLELSELVKELEEAWGVSAAAPVAVAVAGGGAAGGAGEGAEEAQTEFDVLLTAVGDKKIQVIKAVRELTGLGLKEAKAVVDGVPSPVKEGVTKEEAEEVKEKIEAAGGAVEVK
jgi:large subunit ribosomal protein L7/L12